MIFNSNFSFQTEIKCEDGEIFDLCNFSQNNPHTLISFSGKNITIQNSNCTNCDFSEDVKVENCNTCHTEKSIDEIEADRQADQDANQPEKIYSESEVIRILKSNGVLPEDSKVTSLIEIVPDVLVKAGG